MKYYVTFFFRRRYLILFTEKWQVVIVFYFTHSSLTNDTLIGFMLNLIKLISLLEWMFSMY